MDATHDDPTYCDGGPATGSGPGSATGSGTGPAAPGAVEGRAECVLCRRPTEYPESTRGSTLCPVCQWQEAQRSACSG
ncbi:hypothetical protein ACGFW5_33785 [Streptomyces sp. NPDC048416]|uniref:hypothetical protein n=1 Tax=Streptomyces sp. NPDC048416 TaxID=3365546 RepID=UPI003712EBA9